MISFWRIFWLELQGIKRSKALVMLIAAAVAWMLACPYLLKGDGTETGARELYLHFSLGGVFLLLVIALLSSATGAIAKEREAKRLQLTMIRPVRYFSIALGKILAYIFCGALVLGIAVGVMALKIDLSHPCSHVLSPILPSPREEAKAMYDVYMKDPETPVAVKRAKKATVLRILTQRAWDHYQTIPTNSVASWRFASSGDAVRLRFTNQMDMRQDVLGVFRSGATETVLSNITQAVVVVPLKGTEKELFFENQGKSSLMLRPRRDLNVLVKADSLGWNLVRTYFALIAILSLIISFGVLLSAGLGRPVALFVAFVTLIVGEMSPSVIEQYPDELETKVIDRIGLEITRFAAEVTRPISAMSPLAALSKDECVERNGVAKLLVVNLGLLPMAFAMLSALIMPRKGENMV